MTQFKNLINAREARLGCGITIKPGDGAYVVAHYSLEPGKQFQLNDFSPGKDVRPRKEVGKTLRFDCISVKNSTVLGPKKLLGLKFNCTSQ